MSFISRTPFIFDIFSLKHLTTNATGSHWTHHSTFAHVKHSRPQCLQQVPPTSNTHRSGQEHKEHTPFRSDNRSNTDIQHNIPQQFDISALNQHTLY